VAREKRNKLSAKYIGSLALAMLERATIIIIYIFKVGQFAQNVTLDGGLVKRSSCAAAGRGPVWPEYWDGLR